MSGKVYVSDAPSRLNEDEAKAKLAAASFQNIDDVEYKHGLWSAAAKTAHGASIDLRSIRMTAAWWPGRTMDRRARAACTIPVRNAPGFLLAAPAAHRFFSAAPFPPAIRPR